MKCHKSNLTPQSFNHPSYSKLIRLSQCYLLLTVIELYWHNQKVVNIFPLLPLLLIMTIRDNAFGLLVVWVYQCENYNNLLIDSCLIINHRCFLFYYPLSHCLRVTHSVFIENVAVLPSILELSNATMWLEAQRRSGPLHAPTNAEPRTEILESQISVAWGPKEAGDGAESERSAGQNVVPEPASKVWKCKLIGNVFDWNMKIFLSRRWRRANNATGTSNGQPNSSNDNGSSGASSDDDDDLSQRPLQMYLHHQQYYKQMKELQKQQQQQKETATSDNDDNDVDVN